MALLKSPYLLDLLEPESQDMQWNDILTPIGSNDPTGGADILDSESLSSTSTTGGCRSTCCSGCVTDIHSSLRLKEDKFNAWPIILLLLLISILLIGIRTITFLPSTDASPISYTCLPTESKNIIKILMN